MPLMRTLMVIVVVLALWALASASGYDGTSQYEPAGYSQAFYDPEMP